MLAGSLDLEQLQTWIYQSAVLGDVSDVLQICIFYTLACIRCVKLLSKDFVLDPVFKLSSNIRFLD